MKIMAIDPGLLGGIVTMDNGEVISKMVMPVLDNGKRRILDTAQLVLVTKVFQPDLIITESVHSMPKQGIASSFNFGYGAGVIEGVAMCYGAGFVKVTPQEWMKEVLKGLPKGQKASVIYAKRMCPQIDWKATPRCKKDHDGMTDAYCMAIYAKRIYDV